MPAKTVFRLFFPVLVLFAVLVIAAPIAAGGWAVTTLDQLPANVVAGQPYALGLMIRQHGQTPLRVDAVTIDARHASSGETVSFTARPDAVPGHYQAELNFPQAGRWEWGVQSGLFPLAQPMPPIEVGSGAASAPAAAPAGLQVNPQAGLIGALALLALAGGAVLLIRFRLQKSLRAAGLGLLALAGLLLFAFYSSARVQAEPAQAPASAALTADVETGRQLFLAKGCVVCHVNNRAIAASAEYSVDVGPNLSAYHNEAEYLRTFLVSPTSKNTTDIKMPVLGLSPAEVEALIVFLNDGAQE